MSPSTFTILKILLLPYQLIITIRNMLYDLGIIKPEKLNGIVLSIGGISFGGQGKTSLVLFISKILRKHGYRICILSRGYKRKSRGVVVVSDGKSIRDKIEHTGDEPFLLASRLKDVPVVAAENRYEGGRLAERLFKPEIFILDDGFQHRKLHRDVDIVIISQSDKSVSFLHREPFAGIRRAGLIVLSKLKKSDSPEKLKKRISKYNKNCLFTFDIIPEKIISREREILIEDIRDQGVFVFCGIGNPGYFIHSLKTKGIKINGIKTYKDHYYYSIEDIKTLQKKSAESGSRLIITTEKDWYKLNTYLKEPNDFYYVSSRLEIDPGEEEFVKTLMNLIKKS